MPAPSQDKHLQVAGVVGKPGEGPYMIIVLDLKEDTIMRARYSTYGCTTAEVCGQWVCDEVESKSRSYAAGLKETDLVRGVGAMPLGREHCPGLAIGALCNALGEVSDQVC